MSVTKINDIINPEVMADIIEAKITAQAKLTPYAKVNTDLQGVAGDSITVPAWNYVGDAEDFDPELASDTDAEMETHKLTAGSTKFTVKCAGKSISILQTAINSGLGDPVGQANIQLAKAVQGKIDNDLLESAYTSNQVYDGTAGIIGYKGIVGANGVFEDEEDEVDKVMFIHPEQETQLLQDSDFISADKFTAGVAVNGAIGKIAGAWIKKSKKVKKLDAVEAVQGVYTITISGTVVDSDKITIDGQEFTLTASDDTPAKAVTSLKAKTFTNYTATGSGAVLTLTEKSGSAGHGKPSVSSTGAETFAVAVTTQGVKAEVAMYKDIIIKLEPDSNETEYSEDELPALTIFLKKDVQLDHEWFPKKQRHDFTVAKYYGTALTNGAKVVVAKFAQVAQA